jgi:hypothetical protein
VNHTVFYLNPGATEEIRAIIRAQMPEGWGLPSERKTGHLQPV